VADQVAPGRGEILELGVHTSGQALLAGVGGQRGGGVEAERDGGPP
jgi:hypothetical protein